MELTEQYLTWDEEQVLELKRGHLCQDVLWVPNLVEQLRDDGLMNRETAASISKVKKDSLKMKQLLGSIQKKGKAGHLDKLADILEATHLEKNRWLADAIWNALDMQLRRLPVDEYIKVEAQHLVFAEFAPRAKRMSDTERRQMKSLLMYRTQIEKNILTNNIEKIMIDGSIEKRQADTKDTAAGRILKTLIPFCSETIKHSESSEFKDLKKPVQEIFDLLKENEAELDKLEEEQARGRELMNMQDDEAPVDEELLYVLENHAQEMKQLKADEDNLDMEIAHLEEEIVQLSNEFQRSRNGKERILRLLRDEINHFRDLMTGQEAERQSLLIQIRNCNLDRDEEIQKIDEVARWQENMTNKRSHRMSIMRLVEDLEML